MYAIIDSVFPMLMDVYKQFSKRFFSKKSIDCMKKNCNMKKNIPELTKLIKSLEIFINGHRAISKGYKLKPIKLVKQKKMFYGYLCRYAIIS